MAKEPEGRRQIYKKVQSKSYLKSDLQAVEEYHTIMNKRDQAGFDPIPVLADSQRLDLTKKLMSALDILEKRERSLSLQAKHIEALERKLGSMKSEDAVKAQRIETLELRLYRIGIEVNVV